MCDFTKSHNQNKIVSNSIKSYLKKCDMTFEIVAKQLGKNCTTTIIFDRIYVHYFLRKEK